MPEISIHAPREGRDRLIDNIVQDCKISIHAPREGRDDAGRRCSSSCRNFNPRAPRGARRHRIAQIFNGFLISIHAPREGRDLSARRRRVAPALFQSTRPARGATLADLDDRSIEERFQSTRPARGATSVLLEYWMSSAVFQSTRPARGATAERGAHRQERLHFNPRAPRGARLCRFVCPAPVAHISIHAPREGRDLEGHGAADVPVEISIHAPREGRDQTLPMPDLYGTAFQSTRPARGATNVTLFALCATIYFNPRAPRGARRGSAAPPSSPRRISIHAPREGRDVVQQLIEDYRREFQSTRPARGATGKTVFLTREEAFQSTRPARGATGRAKWYTIPKSVFQSTRPARGATGRRHRRRHGRRISIHAPREGRDPAMSAAGDLSWSFQSTRPARGATSTAGRSAAGYAFQSTRPARGATSQQLVHRPVRAISIHAPREGRDPRPPAAAPLPRYFNPRAPRGARQQLRYTLRNLDLFQSTRPARGATFADGMDEELLVFQSTRPARGATPRVSVNAVAQAISIHAPREGRDPDTCRQPPPCTHFNPRAPRGARRSF